MWPSQNIRTLPDEGRDQIGKFEIGWCILHRMAADNASNRVKGTFQKPIEPKITAFDSVLWHGSKFIRPE